MPTAPTVTDAIHDRLASNYTAHPLRFKNEDVTLPDTPATFIYVEIIFDRPTIAGFGGGRGSNLQRTTGRIEAHVMVPVGSGTDDGMTEGEAVCAVFRGLRVDEISYFTAQAMPMDGRTEDGSYAHVCTALIEFQFDQSA